MECIDEMRPFSDAAGGPGANGQSPGPGAPLTQNDRLDINRMTKDPGHRSDPPGKTHPESTPSDVLAILLTPGDVEISTAGEKAETGHFEAGKSGGGPSRQQHTRSQTSARSPSTSRHPSALAGASGGEGATTVRCRRPASASSLARRVLSHAFLLAGLNMGVGLACGIQGCGGFLGRSPESPRAMRA